MFFVWFCVGGFGVWSVEFRVSSVMKELRVGGGGDGDDDMNGGGGGCPLVDVIGSDGGGGDDGDSNESAASNKTDIESQPTKWYAEFERPSQRISKRDYLFRVFRSECRVSSCSFLV